MAIKHFKKRKLPLFFFTSFLIVFLGLSLFHFEFVPTVKANPDSNTWQVGQSSDDCYRRLVSSVFSITDASCRCGDFSSTNYDYSSGMRFTSITIPQGSTIDSAYLKLKASALVGAIPETFIEGENSDNAVTFSTAEDYDGRPRTSANVSWTPPVWVDGTWYTSSDIKIVIQEIVDRGGWISGNALALFWRDAPGWGGVQNRAYAYSYDSVVADAPKLEVTWTEEEGDEYSYTFTETLKPSTTLNQWQEHAYTTMQTLVATSTLNYGAEAVYTFTQTITPSETITYYQEHVYTLIQPLNLVATLNYGIEGIQIFIETFTETLNPTATMHYWMEMAHSFTTTQNFFDAFQPIGAELIYILTETLTQTTQLKTTQEILQIFLETLRPTTILNYAMELAELFITNVEILTSQAFLYYSIQELVEEITIEFALAALGIILALVALALVAVKKG